MPQGKWFPEPSKATCVRRSCVSIANRETKTRQSINLRNFITMVWGQFGRRGEFNCKTPMSQLPEASNWSGKIESQCWLWAKSEGWGSREACHHLWLEGCRWSYWKVGALNLAFLLWMALNSSKVIICFTFWDLFLQKWKTSRILCPYQLGYHLAQRAKKLKM